MRGGARLIGNVASAIRGKLATEFEFGFSFFMALDLATPRIGRAERTAAALKDAARRIIARDGFDSCRIADIAADASRGIGTFYTYFPSKEALLAALAEDFRQALAACIRPPRATADEPLAHLRDSVRAFWETYQAHRAIAVAVFQMAMQNERFADIWRRIRQDGTRVSAARIRQAQATGLCPGLDPDRAATALCAMVEFACFEWSGGLGGPPAGETEGEAVVATLAKLMTNAIGWREP